MTQEEKDLLLRDLCARLPYRTKIQLIEYSVTGKKLPSEIKILDYCMLGKVQAYCNGFRKDEIKPYLFPLSSMTEEQTHEFYCRFIENDIPFEDFVADYWNTNSFHKLLTSIDCCGRVIEWFNENHCDYRGLIPMGLATDATNLNIY